MPNGLRKKAEAFQAKEAQCHKKNYDKWCKVAALEVGDMVLVHVTTFKGHHKIQDRWENMGYVVEKWPYSDVPVYVVCPRDGEGCSQTLHRNYFFPSTPTQGRMRRAHPWQELRITTLQLQCHLWTVSLLMQDHLGWSHQAQQVAHPMVVWINLLHLDLAHKNPELTPMEVPEIQFASRCQATQCLCSQLNVQVQWCITVSFGDQSPKAEKSWHHVLAPYGLKLVCSKVTS